MKKSLKTILIIVIVIAVIGGCIGGYFIWHYNNTYIGKNAAMKISLDDAGLNLSDLIKKDVEFEKTMYSAWYDLEFETHTTEYTYTVDAVSGEILNKYSEPEHAG